MADLALEVNPDTTQSAVLVKESKNGEHVKLMKVKPIYLAWKGVSFTVGEKHILNNLTGAVDPGEICAVMGPSGSGKTTLMDFIASRLDDRTGRTLSGEVRLNGKVSKTADNFGKFGAYVPQDEALVGVLTVRETLNFSARLTVGGKSSDQLRAICDELIIQMGLSVAADTIVGTVFQKGLSGGQKRRLSVAVELIRSPSLLILDEPTSGLDAASAFAEIQHLKHLAKSGHTIVFSIHQPSSEIWNLFDKVSFMSRGEPVYFGAAGEIFLEYFKNIGHPVPTHTNPADHAVALINADFPGNDEKEVKKLVEKFRSHETKERENEADRKTSHNENSVVKFTRPNFFVRLFTLMHRNSLETIRDPGILGVRLAMYTMLALVIGLMYLNLGDDKDFESINSRISCLFYVAAFMVFMSVAALPFFIWQRAVFIKERSNQAYDVPEYVLAKFFVSIPGIFLLALLTATFVVPLAKLNGFGIYLTCLFISLMVAEAFMSMMAVIVPHYIIGIALAAGVFGFFMLCQGFFIVRDEIPPWFIWGYYVAFHTYSFRVFMFNEFDPIDTFDTQIFPSGEAVLEFYSMENVDVGRDLGILIAFLVFFQLLFGFLIWKYHTGKR